MQMCWCNGLHALILSTSSISYFVLATNANTLGSWTCGIRCSKLENMKLVLFIFHVIACHMLKQKFFRKTLEEEKKRPFFCWYCYLLFSTIDQSQWRKDKISASYWRETEWSGKLLFHFLFFSAFLLFQNMFALKIKGLSA